jgi:hypothetical protein
MVDAKKCDRCGEFYEDHSISRHFRVMKDVNRHTTSPSRDFKKRDLCDVCYDSFIAWFESK